MRTRPLLITMSALALVLTACGSKQNDGQAGGTGTTTPPTSTSTSTRGGDGTSSPTPSTDHHAGADDGDAHAQPFPADANPDTGQASAGAFGNITAIRLGHHDGFDRVVFEFHGTGTPGWTVKYVPQALGQGSGLPISIPGSAVLEVGITGVGIPPDTGVQEVATGPVSVHDTEVVTEAYFNGTFEGVSQAFIGTTSKQPFRVYLLTGPARIVVEVVSP